MLRENFSLGFYTQENLTWCLQDVYHKNRIYHSTAKELKHSLKNEGKDPCLIWFSWLENHPVDLKVTGSIPGQGTYPSCECGFDHVQGMYKKAANWCFSLSQSAPTFLSLKVMKNMSSGEDFFLMREKTKASVIITLYS